MWPPIRLLLNPWVLAAGAGLAGYGLLKRSQKQSRRLRDAQDELIEQERTIARLRAEVARTRNAGASAGPSVAPNA